jgi:hypothetical protein
VRSGAAGNAQRTDVSADKATIGELVGTIEVLADDGRVP